MSKSALIIFVKNPVLGKAKTRLAKTIGAEKALRIYEMLLHKTHEVVLPLHVDLQVYYTDYIDRKDLWENERFDKYVQVQEDLGIKMSVAFQKAFDQGYEKVCIIGSDCWDLTTAVLEEAFEQLNEHNFTVGPSVDGGYYLLGMKRLEKSLFEEKQWSTSTVFKDTIESIEQLNASYAILPMISDIDVEADLGEWANEILAK
jgi:rSAM/selenodomain-associated transferase 1